MLERFNEDKGKILLNVSLPQDLLQLEHKLYGLQPFLPKRDINKVEIFKQNLAENKVAYSELIDLFKPDELNKLISKNFSFAIIQNEVVLEAYRAANEKLIAIKELRKKIEEGIHADLFLLREDFEKSLAIVEKVKNCLYVMLMVAMREYHKKFLLNVATTISEGKREQRREKLKEYFLDIGSLEYSYLLNGIEQPERIVYNANVYKNNSYELFLRLVQNIYYHNDKEMVQCLNEAFQKIKGNYSEIDNYLEHQAGYVWDYMILKPLFIQVVQLIDEFSERGVQLNSKWQSHLNDSNAKIRELESSAAIQELLQYSVRLQTARSKTFKEVQITREAVTNIEKLLEQLNYKLQNIQELILIITREKTILENFFNEDYAEVDLNKWKIFSLGPIDALIYNQQQLVANLNEIHENLRFIISEYNKLSSSLLACSLKQTLKEHAKTYQEQVVSSVNLINNADHKIDEYQLAQSHLDKYALSIKITPLTKLFTDRQSYVCKKIEMEQQKKQQALTEKKNERILELLNLIKEAVAEENSFVWQQCIKYYSAYKINGLQVPGGIKELHDIFGRYNIDMTNDFALLDSIKSIAKQRFEMASHLSYRFFVTRNPKAHSFYRLLMNLPDDLSSLTEGQLNTFKGALKGLGLRVPSIAMRRQINC